MRKRPISDFGGNGVRTDTQSWLDLEKTAVAELSSEDALHPFEHALRADTSEGWKASEPGSQLLRIRFDTPQHVQRVHLSFYEDQVDRSQEIALFVTSKSLQRKELVRQQWAFSRFGSHTETEDYYFDLKEVELLELEIDPGRHDKRVFASLQSIQIG